MEAEAVRDNVLHVAGSLGPNDWAGLISIPSWV